MYDDFRHEYLFPASRTHLVHTCARTASDSCGPPRSFSNSLFIPLSYFRSLHCYPTPNLFRPFFSPIKRRPQTKLLPTTFQLSTYSIPECWTFLDDRRVVLRSRESGSHTTRNVTAARREYTHRMENFCETNYF